MKEKTDAELVVLLKSDSPEAFTEMFKRYKPILLPFINKWINNIYESHDILHDIFSKIWKERETINIPCEGLREFLYRCVKNKLRDEYKHYLVTVKYKEYALRTLPKGYDNADHLTLEKENIDHLNKVIERLPRKMRVVFELSRNEFMSRSQIATKLNIPENSVKSNMQRALSILKKYFNVA